MKHFNFSRVIAVVTLLAVAHLGVNAASRLRGDVNGDGYVNISDATALISMLLLPDAEQQPMAEADFNADGTVNISDAIMLINLILNEPESPPNTETITVNGVSFTMVEVEGGSFLMGAIPEEFYYAMRNESPAHDVTLSGYYIGQTEVTWELWLAVMDLDPSLYNMDPQCPVVKVSLFDCARFVDKLSELTGKVFRLPTEAEWEYAARGGCSGVRYRYVGGNDLDEVAWYLDNSDNMAHPVAGKMPNSLGIYDMSGNVGEWCQDWYGGYSYEAQVNPVGPESGVYNVVRGGAWNISHEYCHVTYRTSFSPEDKYEFLGFRIVMNK